jgi:G3E family GTPase
MFASSLDTGRIPVIAVLGMPGSGKTYFLNHLLRSPGLANSIVLTASADARQCHDYDRVQRLPSLGQPTEDGCLCCGMRSGLGDALRDLFLRALSKKIPPVARVVIEADTIDPGPLKFTLKHAPFLGQRYVFQFVFLMLDVSNLSPDVLKLQGLGIEDADYVVFSKADKVTDEHLRAAELAVKQLNPKAKLVVSVDKLEALLANTLH